MATVKKYRPLVMPAGVIQRGLGMGDYRWFTCIARPAKGDTMEAMRSYDFWPIDSELFYVDVYPVDGSFSPTRLTFAAGELAATPTPSGSPQDWNLRDRARASFDPERSGDVVVLLDRAVAPIPFPAKGYTATHGSAWDYDRRVPLMFWRKGINGFEQPAPVETVDIAPTLAAVLGLKVPDGSFDGRCLDLDGSEGNSCQ